MPLSLPEDAVQPRMTSAATNADRKLLTADMFSPLLGRTLQPAAAALPAAVGSVESTPATPEPTASISQLLLVGTIGESIALIKGPDGSVQIVEVGDDVDGAAVLRITPSRCDMRVNGKLTTLRVPPPADYLIVQPAQ